MKFRCLMIALAFLAALASDSWGQSKRSTPPREETKTSQQRAAADQRGTEQSPAVVKIIPTPKTAEEAEADRKEKEQKDTNDTRLVWFTGLLAGIGFLQMLVFGWQGIQLKLTVDAARAATKLAREEFIATHRPRVILRYIQGPFFNDAGHQFIWLTFVNTGANDAIVEAFGGDLALRRDEDDTWEVPGLDASQKTIKPIVITCGQRHVFEVTGKYPAASDKAIFHDAMREHQVCAVGSIRYRDGNGVARDTGFFRVLDDLGENFVLSEHDAEMEYQD
jgi:hypothetical protein